MPVNPVNSSKLLAPGLALALLGAATSSAAWAADGKRVALVIGIGEYPNLPPELHLAHARQDAEALARVLRDQDGFEVMELKDGFATRQAIESFLVQSLPGMVGPDDTLLIYIEAHGMGADFDDPYVLPADARPEDIENTGMRISELGRRVRDAVNVRALVLLTDTAHEGELGGLALLGPNARSWPDLPENTFILSASAMREPAAEGMFASILVRAFQGEADASGDGSLTASELHRFVLEQAATLSGDQMHPTEAGHCTPGLVLFQVPQAPAPVATTAPPPPTVEPTPPPVIPEVPGDRHRRLAVGLPTLGAAALLEAGSLYAYIKGHKLEPVVVDRTEPVPEGEDGANLHARYTRMRKLNLGLGIGAGVLAATGGFFVLVPVQDGAVASMSLRF
ncbi:MAG: caspase family protein [Pseudomonadota bacterium]